MSIAFRCPQCAKAFAVPDAQAGKSARCKACGLRFQVPYGSEIGLSRPEALEIDDLEPRPKPAFAPPLPPQPAASSGWAGRGAWGVAFAVLIVGFRLYAAFHRHNVRQRPANPIQAPAQGNARAPFVPGELDRRNAAAFVMPPFPERGPGRETEPGVNFQAVRMGPQRPGPGALPTHGMTLWLYLPKPAAGQATPGPRSLPCVLIAPAGSRLITGYELDDGETPGGDHLEHLPYVRAGFAVLAYGLDGNRPERAGGRPDALVRASKAFLGARAGLSNAKVALEWLLAKVPEVDPERLYTAGHSSAGTMALLLAENEPRVKAVAAFAPAADVSAHFDGAQQRALRRMVPGVDEFFTTYNPAFHGDRLNCPVFLFYAKDDGGVASIESFAGRLRELGKAVTVDAVPEGGHYEPMIDAGIPHAIAWLKGIDPGL